MYMFTERHYIAVAALLKKSEHNHPSLIEAFCELFDKDNERFKPELFKKASGFSEEIPVLTPIDVKPRPLAKEVMQEFKYANWLSDPVN